MLSVSELGLLHTGDSIYFAALQSCLDRRLCARIYAYGIRGDDVDDVVQETWVRAFEHRGEFVNRGPFYGWVSRICRNVCADLLRQEHQSPERPLGAVDIVESTDSGSAAIIRRGERGEAFRDWVQDQIMSFPRRQRRGSALRWLLGWSLENIASFLGLAPGTVNAELFRAREKLRSRISDWQAKADSQFDGW